MKKTILVSLIMILMLKSFGQNLKALDEKNGFRDYKFGDSISKFTNLKLYEMSKDSLTGYYTKLDDKLKIGDFDVTISYSFYKKVLSLIIIRTIDYNSSRGLLSLFKQQYGDGYKENQYIEDYSWWGKEVTLSYNENSATHKSTIYMWSNSIQNFQKKDKEEKVKNAAKDL
jgi:hypothetical protein